MLDQLVGEGETDGVADASSVSCGLPCDLLWPLELPGCSAVVEAEALVEASASLESLPGCCTVAQNAVIASSSMAAPLAAGALLEVAVLVEPAAEAIAASLKRKPTLSCDP